MNQVLEDLYESCLNVGFDGTPPDPYVAQLLSDAYAACSLLARIRDEGMVTDLEAECRIDGQR